MSARLHLVFAFCKSRWHDVCIVTSQLGSLAKSASPCDQQSDG